MLGVIKAIREQTEFLKENSLAVGVLSVGEVIVEKITATAPKDLVVAIATGNNVLFKEATETKVTITDEGNITAVGTVTAKDMAVTDDLTVSDDATITGDLTVTGAITGDVTGDLEGTLAVHETGDATGAAPTEIEVATEFGAASEQAKAGIVGIFQVTGGLSYLVVTDKTSYQIVALAEAET